MTADPGLTDLLRPHGLHTAASFWPAAFSRNLGAVTRGEFDRLARATVAIPGMGGVGGHHLVTLARAGVGRFHIADFDRFEPANFNRQHGARVTTLGREKTAVMREDALSLNPYLDLRVFPEGVTDENLGAFLTGVDVVVDGLDFFCWRVRRRLFNEARRRGIPVVTAGPIGFGTAVLVFTPGGMGFDDYFDIHDDTEDLEAIIAFYAGLVPAMAHLRYADTSRVHLERKSGPSLSLGCQLASGAAAAETLRLLLNRPGLRPAPHYFQFDMYLRRSCAGRLPWGNRGPLQRLKRRVIRHQVRKKQDAFRPCPPAPDWDRRGPIPAAVVRYVLEAGIQAPSGDNAQPWKFTLRPDGVDLHLDADRDRSFFNVRQYASLLSCGAVLEHLRAAATAYGLDTRIDPPPGGPGDRVAAVTFTPADIPRDPLADALWERETNRLDYDPGPLPAETLTDLAGLAEGLGARLYWVTEDPQRKNLARAVYWADRLRVMNRGVHEHLHRMIRTDADDARRRGDGFSYNNLCAGPAGRLFLSLTRPWARMRLSLALGLGDAVAGFAMKGMTRAPAHGFLTVPGRTPQDFVNAGRALARVWLDATRRGLALQPMAALNLFWLRLLLEGSETFTPAEKQHLDRALALARPLFPRFKESVEGPAFLFRIGRARPIPEGTFRRPLDSFLL